MTSPGVIYKDLLIIGGRVSESADGAPGNIRAFDVRTGERKWIFHTIPHPGEKGYDTWPDTSAWHRLGGANSWPGLSLDEERGIVYVPTGSISGDFYGGFRPGTNLYANSIIALEAATGKYIWHFQVIHHDIWDRDLPATPNLVTLHKDGKMIDAVAQITKHGYVFLFNRLTGEPIFPIEEKPVPQGGVPGEVTWPTQPIPTLPEPFARQKFDSSDIADLDPESHRDLVEQFKMIKHGTPFDPPSKDGVWIFPGFDGGGEWGGSAVDPESGILYVNSSELPWSITLINKPSSIGGPGQSLYVKYCVGCHGAELKGNGSAFPSLVNLKKKYSDQQITSIITSGRNRMPSFGYLKPDEHKALIAFLTSYGSAGTLKTDRHGDEPAATGPQAKSILDEVPYTHTGYNRFLDKNGNPGIKPPWGTLNAVDLNSGKLLWKVPLGEFPDLTAKGIPPTGTETYGGPLVTKGGLVFIAGTKDEMIRAFDTKSGKVLWEAKLPAAGFATPACYSIDGKEYVVIACGGGKIGMKSGDDWVAFALPD
jgi:quinoprotein glucose dehydrogenase